MEGNEGKLWYEDKVSEGLSVGCDKSKLDDHVDFFYNREEGRIKFKEFRKEFRAFKRMLKAYFDGKYEDISPSIFVNSFAGILYIGSKVKNYGERIKSLKFLADVGVVLWIFQTIDQEVEKFKNWETTQEVKSIQLA
jgi:hypothetical protein